MAKKVSAMSETHAEVASHWMGNVDSSDVRTPDDFSIKARLRCWWWCGDEAHDMVATPPNEQQFGINCPTCREERRAEYNRKMSLPVEDVPELVAAWRDERPYDGLTVGDVARGVPGEEYGVYFRLRCENDHKIDRAVSTFVGSGCQWCRGNETRKTPVKSLAEDDPEVAALWHPTRNGVLTPESTPTNYRKPLWWLAAHCCCHEWEEKLIERRLGRRPQRGRGHFYCPACQSVYGSLAWLDPELAAEWHEDNDLTAWHVKPFSGAVVAKWRCAANPNHEWAAAVTDRSSGRLCPQCSTAGTSQIEKAFLAAAQVHDPDATAERIERWRVDVLVPSLRLVVEYDGSYWHAKKHATDERKTLALVDAGYKVARIRENDLPHLAIEHDRVRQVSFRPDFGDVDATMDGLIAWASAAQYPSG